MDTLLTRRAAIQRVVALFGGMALVDGDGLVLASFDAEARRQATSSGIGDFTAADVALLDEIAETILPATGTPGAKAAHTGAFMALMVTDAYSLRNQEVFREGLRRVDEECERLHGTPFVQTAPAGRLALVEQLDREQKDDMDARLPAPRSRAPLPEPAGPAAPPHYFRMMKELTLLGYFTSEIGCTQAQRYIESPGRFDPCAPHAPGDRTWAGHA